MISYIIFLSKKYIYADSTQAQCFQAGADKDGTARAKFNYRYTN